MSNAFLKIGVSEQTVTSLAEMGFEEPTQVQAEAIPKALESKDLVVMSRTGTGKTASFGIPIVENIDVDRIEPQALVLAPTRELAMQVSTELVKIGKGRDVRCLAVYGGDSMSAQLESLREGTHVIVGTPGRVLDHLRRGSLELGGCKLLVLDEADKMLDMGFAQEMSEILEFVPDERQTLLFSATIPLGIRALIYNYLSEPEWVLLSEDFAYVTEVRHSYVIAPQMQKDEILYRLIELDTPSASMIFCNTRGEVRTVTNFLEGRGLPVAMISSDLNQRQREKVMSRFRSGEVRHLVATDVAARGIDIDELSHVFVYSTPDSPESYIHRAGRTGRSGRSGDVVSLVAASDLVSFNRLEKRYHLALVERSVPDDAEIKSRQRERLVKRLLDGADALSPSERTRLSIEARNLLELLEEMRGGDGEQRERAHRIATYLLRQTERPSSSDGDGENDTGESSGKNESGKKPRRKRRRRRRQPASA